MRCRTGKKLVPKYLDGELVPGERIALDEHLARCSACRAEYAAQERLWALLLRVEPIAAPDVTAVVEARLSEQRGWRTLLDGLRLRAVGWAAATAVLVALFVWTGVRAGAVPRGSSGGERDGAVAEILSDAPPGMEVVAVLDEIGERS
jgi:anti-sigma factor RsiW